MHEMGIAMQILEIAKSSIPPGMQGARVERVNLRVGKLAAVVPVSLRFCFEVIAKETPLEGAELAIEEVPVQARCKECATEWTISEPAFYCENCRSGAIELLSGRELDIVSIELASEEEEHGPGGENKAP